MKSTWYLCFARLNIIKTKLLMLTTWVNFVSFKHGLMFLSTYVFKFVFRNNEIADDRTVSTRGGGWGGGAVGG